MVSVDGCSDGEGEEEKSEEGQQHGCREEERVGETRSRLRDVSMSVTGIVRWARVAGDLDLRVGDGVRLGREQSLPVSPLSPRTRLAGARFPMHPRPCPMPSSSASSSPRPSSASMSPCSISESMQTTSASPTTSPEDSAS